MALLFLSSYEMGPSPPTPPHSSFKLYPEEKEKALLAAAAVSLRLFSLVLPRSMLEDAP